MPRASEGTPAGGPSERWRDRWPLALAALACVAVAVVHGWSTIDRIRSDTATRAVTVGEAGCVTAARFTDPEGTSHLVSLKVYKGNCIEGDPGETVTVYYDADDPDTNASSRAWWWPGLLTGLAAAAAAFVVRGVARGPAPAPPARRWTPVVPRLRRPRPTRPARPARVSSPPPGSFLTGDGADVSYRWDYALGRTAVVLGRVRAELAQPVADRASHAGDTVLAGLEHQVETMLHCLRGGAVGAAQEHGRVVSRLVVDGMDDSPLADDLLGLAQMLAR